MIDPRTDLLEGAEPAALVRMTEVRGSAPREAGAWMLVTANRTAGTIGGGQLEYMAIDEARALLRGAERKAAMDVPLGPEIGQCCGGRVTLEILVLDDEKRVKLLGELRGAHASCPHVYLFGAGHVGRALALALDPLPVRCIVVDARAEELSLLPGHIETRMEPMPEALVRAAPSGSAFVILTHDHALDFLIAQEALARSDAVYVGMIGSATKRAAFQGWLRRQGSDLDTSRLICPIAPAAPRDKRPEVIAAFAAAEVFSAVCQTEVHARTEADR